LTFFKKRLTILIVINFFLRVLSGLLRGAVRLLLALLNFLGHCCEYVCL